MASETIAHPDDGFVRFIIRLDATSLLLPMIAYAVGYELLALCIVNFIVPVIYCAAITTGIQAFRRWQGRWRSALTAWNLSLSTVTSFVGLCLLADWYAYRGWNIIEMERHLWWAFVHYCAIRAMICYHARVREYG